MIVKNCGQVKETQVVTKSVMKETVRVLDSISTIQKNETIKKDSANAVMDTMSATNKRIRARKILERRKRERLGFAEGEDCECRKLLREERKERQSGLRRADRRLQQNGQRAERKKYSANGRKDSKQISGRTARKSFAPTAKGKSKTKMA
ncbi:hypothetical protein GCM10027035_47820 [Emticicia sediminis]